MAIDKETRGLPPSQLVFVGMHNVAQFWWCGMYAVRKSRRNETQFFAAYLEDRLRYSLALGRIDRIPVTNKQLLDAGGDITLQDVERLLAPELRLSEKPRENKTRGTKLILEPMDEEDYQWQHGETYPTFRWAFPWRKYVVVGIPDGLTRRFVYEFKVTRNRHMFETVARPVATTQADLYGMFFDRKAKRVQIHLREEHLTETITGPVDVARGRLTLGRFSRVDSGILPRPPMAFKCLRCEERDGCPIRQA